MTSSKERGVVSDYVKSWVLISCFVRMPLCRPLDGNQPPANPSHLDKSQPAIRSCCLSLMPTVNASAGFGDRVIGLALLCPRMAG